MTPVRASVILLTFNQEAFVKDALQSLLDQDDDNLEIVVSDDCSHDNTWDVVSKLVEDYKGQKSILLNQNAQNIGLVANYTKAFQLTSGDFIFTAAGDDISLPTRCSSCINYWQTINPPPDLVATDGYDMSLEGRVLGVKKTDDLGAWDLNRWGKKKPFIFGASHMMTRRLIALNNLNPSLMYEDQCFLFRALLLNGAVRLDQPLVKHRRGGVSQKKKNYVYEVKRKKMVDSALDGILESKQMLSDAALCDLKDQDVLLTIKKKNQFSEFAYEMLSESNFWQKCVLMLRASELSFAKRLRYFQFAVLPWLHCLLMHAKHLLRTEK
jgi:glycosyltransferase involved in cell wall biosynthesis